MTYIQTIDDGQFNYLAEDDDLSGISVESIVAGLRCRRWSSQIGPYWCVARHTLLCRWIAETLKFPTDLVKLATLHDLHEAYVTDVPSPLKKAMRSVAGVLRASDWAIIERSAEVRVHRFFGVSFDEIPHWQRGDVKLIDNTARDIETCLLRDFDPLGSSVDVSEAKRLMNLTDEEVAATLTEILTNYKKEADRALIKTV